MDLRTPLGKVKDASHAHGGSHHWILQRLTAILMIPLVIWFVFSIICSVADPQTGILQFLSRPVNAVVMILFLGVSIYHGSLGIRVVYEDYISNKFARNVVITITNYVSIFLAVLSIFAVISYHINNSEINLSKPTPEFTVNSDKTKAIDLQKTNIVTLK